MDAERESIVLVIIIFPISIIRASHCSISKYISHDSISMLTMAIVGVVRLYNTS